MQFLNPNTDCTPSLLQTLAKIGLVMNLLVISTLAFLPSESAPTLSAWDKANHSIAFCVLTILLAFCYKKPTRQLFKRVFLPLVLYGVVIEVVQYALPSRYFSLLDVFADSVGIFIGILVVYAVNVLLLKRFNRTS